MIVSHAHKFVFMHNPKVGGTSIRNTMERFGDASTRFYGTDPDPSSATHTIDRAHIGIDEFATYYPDDWKNARSYTFFVLWRPPTERIISSTNEYSRRFADQDMRFLSPRERRDFLFRTLEELDTAGTAEQIMDQLRFTHFRPQWIYQQCSTDHVTVTSFRLSNISDLFKTIGERVGEPDLGKETSANPSEQINMPGPLGRLIAQRRIRTLLTEAPILSRVTPMIRRALISRQTQQSSKESYALMPDDERALSDFAKTFYAKDYARLPLDD